MPKPPSTWKSIELKVARYLGWIKTHWALRDGQGPGWSLEVKHGMQIPKTLLKWWGQAVTNTSEGELTSMVLHPLGWKIEDSLVIIKLSVFKALLNEKSQGYQHGEYSE